LLELSLGEKAFSSNRSIPFGLGFVKKNLPILMKGSKHRQKKKQKKKKTSMQTKNKSACKKMPKASNIHEKSLDAGAIPESPEVLPSPGRDIRLSLLVAGAEKG
jgi:hypothetical protein